MEAEKGNTEENKKNLEVKALNQIDTKPSLSVDYMAYAHLLENSEMSEEQKRQFIQALWSIIHGFASLGFGVHPVQQAEIEPCGQVEKRYRNSHSTDQTKVEFNTTSKKRGSTIRSVADQSGVEHANQ